MSLKPNFLAQGSIVEFMEDNAFHIAMLLEEANGKLRLLLPSRREVKLASGRILPWTGPVLPRDISREDAARLLDSHRQAREAKASRAPVLEMWEMAQGEIGQAPAEWFAELMESEPGPDDIAAYGRALLACKSHFRFQSPDFVVYDAETVEKRLIEQKLKKEREALASEGSAFLRLLWDVACKKKSFPDQEALDAEVAGRFPGGAIPERIEKMLRARLANPESTEDEALWRLVGKGLPDLPHLPFQLLTAWGKLPRHYNFWLDRAAYAPGDDWWLEFSDEVDALDQAAGSENPGALHFQDLPDAVFISIDSPTTQDIDDAFHIERLADGWRLVVALACPALVWPFGSPFDKAVLHRGTSVYLPECDMHMLPQRLGTGSYSLFASQKRPAFCLGIEMDENGVPRSCQPFLSRLALAANLTYEDVQAVLDGAAGEDNPAAPYRKILAQALELSKIREKGRLEAGAIVMRRPEQEIRLDFSGPEPLVDIVGEPAAEDARDLVAEMMILASSAFADWGAANALPLLHRTQNVSVPREYGGIWSQPQDLARIMRALIPSSLEVEPKPHAALALPRYAPVTSPLRRYTDLVNEAQALHFLESGAPRWNRDSLEALLENLSPALEGAGQIQRFRPRYWKLLYFRQKGDKIWWDGVITEENDNFATVSIPDKGLFVRGKKHLFGERACAGMPVRLRLGKVHPLYNEIQILEALPAE